MATLAPPDAAALDNQKTVSQTQSDSPTTAKTKNRPKSLTLSPFDPSELSHKLSTVASDQDDDSAASITSGSQDSPKEDLMSNNTTPSPNTTTAKALSPKFFKQNASPVSRRTSIFQHFSIKGSNYDPKKDDDITPRPAPYRHVPKNAAAQFAKTTTVSPLTEKATVTKQVKSPGPGCMSNGTMSLQEYNKQSRRTQSLCHGRPQDRSGNNFPLTVLESTAEVDEDPTTLNSRLSLQPNQLRGFDLANEMARRMSTGNMRPGQRGAVEVPPPVVVRNDSTNLSVFRQSSISSADNMSPFHTGSGPTSPLRHEFDQQQPSPGRRGSEANSNPSRRSSVVNPQRVTVVDMYRVDWSQSDQSKRRRDSRWSIMRGRIGSVSNKSDTKESVSGESVEPESPASPKAGFLGRFKM